MERKQVNWTGNEEADFEVAMESDVSGFEEVLRGEGQGKLEFLPHP